jgi:hypothetical protein
MISEEDKNQIIELRRHYRTCFSTSSGKVVLKHMLYEMRLFNDDITADDHDSRVLRNYASTIIERLGCSDDTDATLEAIITAILNLPIVLTNE